MSGFTNNDHRKLRNMKAQPTDLQVHLVRRGGEEEEEEEGEGGLPQMFLKRRLAGERGESVTE